MTDCLKEGGSFIFIKYIKYNIDESDKLLMKYFNIIKDNIHY